MRHSRRGRHAGSEFGGSGEDSFVAVVVTKLTGALLFILLLTMVIMALIPRAQLAATAERAEPLEVVTPARLPEAIVGRPYSVALASRGGSGPISWALQGTLPEGLAFDPEAGTIAGTPARANDGGRGFAIVASDTNTRAVSTLSLPVLEPDQPLGNGKLSQVYARLTWKDWMNSGFGYFVIVAMWIGGLGVVGSLERWSIKAEEIGGERVTSRRFVGYKLVVTLAAVAAGVAFRYWTGC